MQVGETGQVASHSIEGGFGAQCTSHSYAILFRSSLRHSGELWCRILLCWDNDFHLWRNALCHPSSATEAREEKTDLRHHQRKGSRRICAWRVRAAHIKSQRGQSDVRSTRPYQLRFIETFIRLEPDVWEREGETHFIPWVLRHLPVQPSHPLVLDSAPKYVSALFISICGPLGLTSLGGSTWIPARRKDGSFAFSPLPPPSPFPPICLKA